ncbi:MAG: protein-L-isoaspartate(D-aspartate) O-methyltransferase [Burkholderiales bacterium]
MSTLPPDEAAAAATQAALAAERDRMVGEIAQMAQETATETGHGRFSDAVMDAMRKVPRHRFVDPSQERSAYRNHPLPIGRGQTISQPYIVALTTHLVRPQKHHRVLEIGTGSGYQAAVLCELVQHVYTVEIIESLGRAAQRRFAALGYGNVSVRIGDGHAGWPEHAPYDGIVVTAAASHVPPALVTQLKPGGRMAIPIDSQLGGQQFTLVEKAMDGSISQRAVLPVMFVPMTGGK